MFVYRRRSPREEEEEEEEEDDFDDQMKWTCVEDWTGEVPPPRSFHASIPLNAQHVLIAGGVCATTNRVLDDCYVFDVVEKRWTRVNDLPRGNAHGRLVKYHGLILLIGGVSSSDDGSTMASSAGGIFSFFSGTASPGSYESLTSSSYEAEKVKVYALDEENGMSWIESPTTGDVPTEKVGSACVSIGDRAIVLHAVSVLAGYRKTCTLGR